MKLRQRLKQERLKKGYSQARLAKLLGYSSGQFVSNWERDLSFPPVDRLAKMAILFDVDHRGLVNQYLEESSEEKLKEFFKAYDFHRFQMEQQKN